jgi:hypothetical protein
MQQQIFNLKVKLKRIKILTKGEKTRIRTKINKKYTINFD